MILFRQAYWRCVRRVYYRAGTDRTHAAGVSGPNYSKVIAPSLSATPKSLRHRYLPSERSRRGAGERDKRSAELPPVVNGVFASLELLPPSKIPLKVELENQPQCTRSVGSLCKNTTFNTSVVFDT